MLDILYIVLTQTVMHNKTVGRIFKGSLVSLDERFKVSFVTALKGSDKIFVQVIELHIAFIGLDKGRCEFYFFFAKILYAQNFIVDFPKLKSARPNRRKNIVPYFRLTQPLAAYYGLRRSEVIGLKWSAIDFTENTLTVRHTVHSTEEGIVAKDRLKTKSSYRTLTLEPFVRGELLKHREKQEQMKKVMRSAYSGEYTDYVCVDALGKLYDPDFVTGHFGQLLKKHNLKKIRFHDLRHSCASVLLAQGVPMKQIQEWLGHSDMSTTANIYSHLDAVTKADTGAAMSKALG